MKVNPSLLLLTLLAASLEPVLARLGYNQGVTPIQLLYCKSLVGAVVVLPMTVRFRPSLRALPAALLLLLTGASQLWALQCFPAATVITLFSTTPAVVALINQWLGREKPTLLFWLGLMACLVGIGLSLGLAASIQGSDPMGWLFITCAILSSSLYRAQLEGLRGQIPSLRISTTLFLVQGLLLSGLAPELPTIPTSGLALGAWLGLAGVAANLTFVQAVHAFGSTRMSVFNLLQRPLVIVAAAWLLGEALTVTQWLGVALVILGVGVAQSQTGNTRG